MAGSLGVRKQHRHACRFGGDDERAKVHPKALDLGFGAFLLFGLTRHTTPRSGRFGPGPGGDREEIDASLRGHIRLRRSM